MKRLSKNRVFTWKCIGYIFIMNGLGGQMMNMPKYIETQYRVSAAKASFLTGEFIHHTHLYMQHDYGITEQTKTKCAILTVS